MKAPVRQSALRIDNDEVAVTNVTADDYGGSSPTFAALCRKADEKQARKPPDLRCYRLRVLMDDVSLERAWTELNFRSDAAASTVEALMFSLRERGVGALVEPDCRRRLTDLSAKQLEEVTVRLARMRGKYPKITDELMSLIVDLLP
jgi:hypothetical protein